jgi:copper transport protein
MRGRVRRGLAVGFGVAALLCCVAPAAAHALLVSANPKVGAALTTAPTAVTITFTEQPDPRLSTIRVLDQHGSDVTAGPTVAVAGQPRQLQVPLRPLAPGVYTVAWRTLSSVDGHLAAGSYAFGVGVTPPAASSAASSGSVVSGAGGGDVNLSPPALIGRWLLYAGLMLLVGTAFVGTLVYPAVPARSAVLASIAWLSATAGAGLVSGAQIANAGVGLADAFATSLGTTLLLRLVPVLTGLAVLATLARWRPLGRTRLALLGAAGAGGMLADALASHAAASGQTVFNVAVQWVHVAAAGTWLGGLLALLLTLSTWPSPDRSRVARRFATSAVVGIVAVSLTGLLRAIAEVGTWNALLTTDYGHLVIAKSALLVVLAGLGGLNHFRNAPAASRSLRGLRLAGSTELAITAGVVALTATLVNLAPPVQAAPSPGSGGPQPIVVTAHDFGTTLRARLRVSPGTTGFNTFEMTLTDYDSGAPLTDRKVALSFSIPARPDIGASNLDLKPAGGGVYAATGPNLSIDGAWRITAIVSGGQRAVQVMFDVTASTPQPKVDVNAVPGLPTIYTVHVGGGNTVQIYLDPGKPGANELHATFFDPNGNELPVPTAQMSMGPKGQPLAPLTPRRLEPGHFVADTSLAAGTFAVSVTGAAPGGQPLTAQLDIPVSQ